MLRGTKLRTFSQIALKGYTVDQLNTVLPKALPVKSNTVIAAQNTFEKRSTLAYSLGMHLEGFAPLGPDIRDAKNIVRGATHRFCREVPKSKYDRQIRNFVRLWLRKNMQPLSVEADFSLETWLSETKYPAWRKEELRNCEEPSNMFKNKSFIKSEFYPSPKHARWINSRTDFFKKITGPYFHAIEKEIFKREEFIKTVPVMDRSQYIFDKLYSPGASYLETDYTSFEASIVPSFQKICEFQLYSYMLRNCPNQREILDLIKKGLGSIQKCHMRHANGKAFASTVARMSGDMCTSLGNGFTNLMLIKFMAHIHNWKECDCVIEGDDGLVRINGRLPDENFFSDIGFIIKKNINSDLGNAGFCQISYAGQNYSNLVDPIKNIVHFGWSMSRLATGNRDLLRQLLLAKAFSLICETQHTPIISKLALKTIEILKGTEIRKDLFTYDPEQWWMEQVLDFNRVEECMRLARQGPSDEQRQFVADKWCVSVPDQLEAEKYIEKISDVQPLDIPCLYKYISYWHSWSWDTNVEKYSVGDKYA